MNSFRLYYKRLFTESGERLSVYGERLSVCGWNRLNSEQKEIIVGNDMMTS